MQMLHLSTRIACLTMFFLGRTQAFVVSTCKPMAQRFHRATTSSQQEPQQEDELSHSISNRRDALARGGAIGCALLFGAVVPSPALARLVMDEETGDYVEVEDVPWQSEWKARIDKASTMSKDEIFQAARGAGNTDLKQGPESDASKKRRAMSGCRDATLRAKAEAGNEKECNARVFAGEVDFMINQL